MLRYYKDVSEGVFGRSLNDDLGEVEIEMLEEFATSVSHVFAKLA